MNFDPGATPSAAALDAATTVHHALFTGLILAVAGRHGQAQSAAVVERTLHHRDLSLQVLDGRGWRVV